MQLSCFYMILGISSFYAIVVLVVALAVPKDTQGEVVGSICVIIGTLMYASPLAVMVHFLPSSSPRGLIERKNVTISTVLGPMEI